MVESCCLVLVHCYQISGLAVVIAVGDAVVIVVALVEAIVGLDLLHEADIHRVDMTVLEGCVLCIVLFSEKL